MKFWQIAVIAVAILLLGVVVVWLMQAALVAAEDSVRLGVVLFSLINVPGLITFGIVYGVWRLGDRGTPIPDKARLKRSYERNLGHSRFWAGVGTVLLAGMLLFVANTLWEVGTCQKVWTPLASNAFAIGIFILDEAIALSFVLAWTFRNLYRLDDRVLTEIE